MANLRVSKLRGCLILVPVILLAGLAAAKGFAAHPVPLRIAHPSQAAHPQAAQPQVAQPITDRQKVAEGEYRVYRQASDGGIGPFNPAIHDFSETWTLWRLRDGSFEVEGARTYEAPQYESHRDPFAVRLSPKFTVSQITEFKKLRWRPDSGPLKCNFLPEGLDCDSGARDPAQEVRLKLPLKSAYGFLWPISAFSMTNITRFAERKAGSSVPVSMITIDEPSAADPVVASVLEGRLRYVGQEELHVAGAKWQADKFELKVPLNPPCMIWTSPQGLLLDFTLEDNAKRLTEHGMSLVKYEQFGEW
jgi:hypothetical protein